MNVTEHFNRIYDATWERVRRYLYPRVRAPEDLADILQETYLELYRALERGNDPNNSEAFVMHIAKQKLARHYKAQSNHAIPIDWEDTPEVDQYDLDRWLDESLEDQIVIEQLSNTILSELPREPWPIRQIFTCIFSMEMKMPEVASALDLSVNQVRNLYYRTLRDLRQRYAESSQTNLSEKETVL